MYLNNVDKYKIVAHLEGLLDMVEEHEYTDREIVIEDLIYRIESNEFDVEEEQ